MELLFPKNIQCIFCSLPVSRENYLSLCKKCYRRLSFVEESCVRCGRSGKGRSLCTDCTSETYHFDRVFSVLEYNDAMHHQIYGYKYGQKSYLGKYFGHLMRDFVVQNKIEYDFVVPVPISKGRERSRGFNQSLLLAKGVDEKRTVELFVREKNTAFLSGLSKANRFLELQNAFSMDEGALNEMLERYYCRKEGLKKELRPVEDKNMLRAEQYLDQASKHTGQDAYRLHPVGVEDGAMDEAHGVESEEKLKILLVDDILTTGSTLNELAKLARTQIHRIEITALTLCNARK